MDEAGHKIWCWRSDTRVRKWWMYGQRILSPVEMRAYIVYKTVLPKLKSRTGYKPGWTNGRTDRWMDGWMET